MGRTSGNVIGDLTRVLQWGTATGDGDDRLLERFLAGRDESAFTALVARHGPMVLGVCRRVLRDEHDVEDAFQATFLVLVRSAGAIRSGELVGPWLHGVARRVAVRARAGAARRLVRERNGTEVQTAAVAAEARNADHAELRMILDAELARLPEALRAPLVLCYLEGLTHEQAAGRLRQPVGTIRSRLSRGRDRLRARLARRGVSADDAAWGSMAFAEPVSTRLFEATVRTVLDSTIPGAAATALVSATAASLAKGVLDAMLITKLKLAGACAMGLVLTMGGVSGYTLQQGPGDGKVQKKELSDAAARSPLQDATQGADRKLIGRLDRYISELDRRKKELQDDKGGIEAELRSVDEQLNVMRRKREELGAGSGLGPVEPRLEKPHDVPTKKRAEPRPAPGPGQAEPPEPDAPGDHANHPRPLPFVQAGKIVIVASPDGHVVTGYSSETGKVHSIRLAGPGEPELEVVPAVNAVLGILFVRGLEIRRVAVFNSIDGRWHAQDLAEAATKAEPILGATGMACYAIGSRVYAFSGPAARWDVLKLPDGSEPKPVMGMETISCQAGDHLHVFSIKTGTWTDIDTRVAAEPADRAAPAAPERESAEVRKSVGTTQPEYLDPNKPIVVASQGGRVVTIFGVRNHTMGGMMGGPGMDMGMGGMMGGPDKSLSPPLSVRLAAEGDPGLEASPVFGQGSIALVLRGEKIQRLAMFNMNKRRWDVQDLREPVKEAIPVSSDLMTTYALGRRLYTYSSLAGRWSVLELPEGASPRAVASDRGLTLRYGDKIHIYNLSSGEWADFDLQATPEESKPGRDQRRSR